MIKKSVLKLSLGFLCLAAACMPKAAPKATQKSVSLEGVSWGYKSEVMIVALPHERRIGNEPKQVCLMGAIRPLSTQENKQDAYQRFMQTQFSADLTKRFNFGGSYTARFQNSSDVISRINWKINQINSKELKKLSELNRSLLERTMSTLSYETKKFMTHVNFFARFKAGASTEEEFFDVGEAFFAMLASDFGGGNSPDASQAAKLDALVAFEQEIKRSESNSALDLQEIKVDDLNKELRESAARGYEFAVQIIASTWGDMQTGSQGELCPATILGSELFATIKNRTQWEKSMLKQKAIAARNASGAAAAANSDVDLKELFGPLD